MLNTHAADILAQLNAIFGFGSGAARTHGLPLVSGGHGVAVATVQLMRETFVTLPTQAIVDAYIAEPAVSHLYDLFSDRTVDVIANGCRTLAMIYDSAWKANPWQLDTAQVAEADLSALHLRKIWAPSRTLDSLELPGSASA